MPAIRIPTNFNIDLEFETPEFHRRMFAWFIDLMIQLFYLFIAFRIYGNYVERSFNDETYENIPWMIRILLVPVIIYHIVSEMMLNGQSIGKRLMGLRVVNENGGRASISQFIIRCLIRTSDYIIIVILLNSLIYGPAFLYFYRWALLGSILLFLADIALVASSKKNQRIGDILAHTILIKTNPKGNVNDTVFMEVADNYVPVFPQVMQLSDKDMNAVKNIIDTAIKKGDFSLAAMAAEKIKNHLHIESSLSPFDFLETVLKDYNYLSVK